MINQETKRYPYLLSAGLFVVSLSIFLQRSMPASLPLWDITTGLCMGIGIGLILLAILLIKK